MLAMPPLKLVQAHPLHELPTLSSRRQRDSCFSSQMQRLGCVAERQPESGQRGALDGRRARAPQALVLLQAFGRIARHGHVLQLRERLAHPVYPKRRDVRHTRTVR